MKNGLLLRITEAQKEVSEAAFQVQEVDWSVVEAEAENARQHSLKEYKDMIDSTLEIPLEKLLFHSIGCDLFDELCLRLDVNQRLESRVIPIILFCGGNQSYINDSFFILCFIAGMKTFCRNGKTSRYVSRFLNCGPSG